MPLLGRRRSYRKYHGVYAPARPGISLFLVALLIVACLLTDVNWTPEGLVVSSLGDRGRMPAAQSPSAACPDMLRMVQAQVRWCVA